LERAAILPDNAEGSGILHPLACSGFQVFFFRKKIEDTSFNTFVGLIQESSLLKKRSFHDDNSTKRFEVIYSEDDGQPVRLPVPDYRAADAGLSRRCKYVKFSVNQRWQNESVRLLRRSAGSASSPPPFTGQKSTYAGWAGHRQRAISYEIL